MDFFLSSMNAAQDRIPFFLIVAVLGIITSWEDQRIGKIRNIWIVSGLIYAFIFYFVTVFLSIVPLNILIINFFISFAVSYGMWKSDIWKPGDAKLFIIYSLLTPPSVYGKVYFSVFPAFNLLMASFIPATISLILIAFSGVLKNNLKNFILNLKLKTQKIKFTIPEKRHLIAMSKVIFGFFCIMLFRKIFQEKLNYYFPSLTVNKNILFFMLFLIYKPLTKIFKRFNLLLLILAFLALFYLAPEIAYRPKEKLIEVMSSFLTSLALITVSDNVMRLIDDHVAQSKTKTMPFAIWLFLGVVLTWFF